MLFMHVACKCHHFISWLQSSSRWLSNFKTASCSRLLEGGRRNCFVFRANRFQCCFNTGRQNSNDDDGWNDDDDDNTDLKIKSGLLEASDPIQICHWVAETYLIPTWSLPSLLTFKQLKVSSLRTILDKFIGPIMTKTLICILDFSLSSVIFDTNLIRQTVATRAFFVVVLCALSRVWRSIETITSSSLTFENHWTPW